MSTFDFLQLKPRVTQTRRCRRPTPESRLIAEILGYLRGRGIIAWRINQQGIPIPGRPGEYRPGPSRGMADIIGIIPFGRFLAIEAKIHPRVATVEQQAFIASVNAAGGLGGICYSVADVISLLSGKPSNHRG
jgi:hypothetical protein